MYYLKFNSHFDGAHFLRNYQGKCARIHGHRWLVEGEVAGEQLDAMGMLVDFHDLKAWLKDICDHFDHLLLNEVEGFKEGQLNPTAENIAYYIFTELSKKISQQFNNVELKYITVWESPGCAATYRI